MGAAVIAGGDGLGFVALGSTFISGVAEDVVMGAVLVGLLVELNHFARFSGCIACRRTHRFKICCSLARYM